MASPFTIPNSAYQGLNALIEIGAEKLAKVAEHVASRNLTLDSERLLTDLTKVTGGPARELETAMDTILIPLSGLRADLGMQAVEFVELLTNLIEEQNDQWYQANSAKWHLVSGSLALLIGPDSYFSQLNKAYGLLVNRPAMVGAVRVLTEMRPVYDDEVTEVKAYLIVSTLAINYQELGDVKRTHFTLDKQDLENLREQVDRALRKIDLLEQQVALLKVPALVAGAGRG